MTAPIRLSMSMSLDGFITGPDDREGQELGRNGGRLFNWLDDRLSPGSNGPVLGFWRRMGFAETGEIRPWRYDKLRSEAILMDKPIADRRRHPPR